MEKDNEDCLIDPYDLLRFTKKADHKIKLQNQVITPINRSRLVQTLDNPLRPGEFITVRVVNQNCIPSNSNNQRT